MLINNSICLESVAGKYHGNVIFILSGEEMKGTVNVAWKHERVLLQAVSFLFFKSYQCGDEFIV